MKNIFAGAIMLGLLPQLSFGADAALTACNQQRDAKSVAFFEQQAQERAVFIKANPNLIAKQDLIGEWVIAQKNAHNSGNTFLSPSPPPLSAQEESIFDAFRDKQLSDKQAFFQQLGNC